MKKYFIILTLIFLTSCATGTFTNRSGDDSNLSFDTGFCRSLAKSKHPGYICKNPLMCTMEEVNILLNDLTQYQAVFQNCMYSKNYNYK
jgi:hypothetical protein